MCFQAIRMLPDSVIGGQASPHYDQPSLATHILSELSYNHTGLTSGLKLCVWRENKGPQSQILGRVNSDLY
jgi:hypothetical protein